MNSAKRLAKNFIASRAAWPWVARWLHPPGVAVLMYHRIVAPGALFEDCSIELFREQMRWLSRSCQPIRPEDFSDCVKSRQRRRRPFVLITFDDGYRDYFDNAYPILKEFGIPAVVFLATSFMDNNRLIWTDEVTLASERASASRVRFPWDENAAFDLSLPGERKRLRQQAKLYLKSIPDVEREREMARLLDSLHVSIAPQDIERQMLNWDEVRATLDLTTYGGHSHTHPILSQVDATRVDSEIRNCRDRLQAEIGVAPKYFAYPNGRKQDFNDTTKRALRKYGFELAFSTTLGFNTRECDPMALKRIHCGNSVADMASLIAGIARS